MDKAASAPKARKAAADPNRDPLADPNATFVPRGEAIFSGIEPGAVGSSLVLVVLIAALGYGGWSVLKEIQKVQLAPVDQAPGVLAELDPLTDAESFTTADSADVFAPTPDALDRLYRPEPLEVPQMVARDAPISTLEPGMLSALAEANVPEAPKVETAPVREVTEAPLAVQESPVQVVENNAPEVVLFAVRPAWVRVTASDGTVLLEKILDEGERFVLPKTEEPPLLRTGYAGAIYFAVNGEAYGPAGEGASVIKGIALGQAELKENYQVADLTQHPDLASLVAEVILPVEDE